MILLPAIYTNTSAVLGPTQRGVNAGPLPNSVHSIDRTVRHAITGLMLTDSAMRAQENSELPTP